MRRKTGFTFIEILLVVVILGILASIGVFMSSKTMQKAKSGAAIITAGNIREAEFMRKAETGNYVAAEATEQVNELLGLNVLSKDFAYRVIGVTDDNFLILAHRMDEDVKGGKFSPESIVVAMDKTGIINYPSGGGVTGGGGGVTGGGGGVTGGGGGVTGGGGGVTGGGGGVTGGGTTSGGGGTTGGGTTTAVSAKATYDTDIAAALESLNGTTNGDYFYHLIEDNNISVIYDDFSKYAGMYGTLGFWWGIVHNTIYVNQQYSTLSPQPAIAAIIIHEATHADYEYYPQKWIDLTKAAHPELTDSDIHITEDTIDQEYNAFVNEVKIWNEIKGSYKDDQCDYWASVYAQGEDYMKSKIRLLYNTPGEAFPEY